MPPKQRNLFFRYGNLAIQMGSIIGLSVWGGQKLDERYNPDGTPIYTIVLSLIGIGAALYVVIKDIIRPK
jgi:hypothetical protein